MSSSFVPPGRALRARGLYPRSRFCQPLALIFLCLALAGCAGEKENVKREAQASYQLAMAFMAEGRPALALRELTKAEAYKPDDPEIKNSIGMAYWAKRELELAETKFKEAVALKSDYSEVWNNLAALYVDQGRYEEAVEAADKALENVFYPTQERPLTNMGWALFKLGRSTEAEQALQEAIEVAPGFPLAHKFLGIVLQAEGRHQLALEQLDLAARAFPSNALQHLSEVHLTRGVSLLKLDRRSEAKAAFEEAWRLSPGTETGKSAKNYLRFLE